MGDFFPNYRYFDYPNAPKNLGVLGVKMYSTYQKQDKKFIIT